MEWRAAPRCRRRRQGSTGRQAAAASSAGRPDVAAHRDHRRRDAVVVEHAAQSGKQILRGVEIRAAHFAQHRAWLLRRPGRAASPPTPACRCPARLAPVCACVPRKLASRSRYSSITPTSGSAANVRNAGAAISSDCAAGGHPGRPDCRPAAAAEVRPTRHGSWQTVRARRRPAPTMRSTMMPVPPPEPDRMPMPSPVSVSDSAATDRRRGSS